jgi:hypothetical protein
MLIMPRWSSASRCRVQVTSNVRHPNKANTKPSQDTRFGKNSRQCSRAGRTIALRKLQRRKKPLLQPRKKRRPKTAQSAARSHDFSEQLASSCFAAAGNQRHSVGWSSHQSSRKRASPRESAASGKAKDMNCGCALFRFQVKLWQHPLHAPARTPPQRMPNPSVNLTRNSVPHLPGMARYAHNALPGKRVTLPRAGYLKR